jgi:protein SCO1
VNPRLLIALFLTSVFALGAVVLAARGGSDEPALESAETGPLTARFEGAVLPQGVRAPDFSLRDQDGEPIRMRGLRGRPVIVTFLYATCEETCPAQAQQVKGALAELGHDVPAIAIAVDPPRDTPKRARAFLAKQRMTGRMDFVLGSPEELRPVWRGFAIQPQLEEAEHQARFTLVDERGFQRIGFPLGQATPERLAHDVRALEREG